ncbi:MAG: MobF family relaxase [Actinomycetota bacterium]
MMRVRTLFASSARAAAEYYAKYLTQDEHEIPGSWTGRQANGLGLDGDVSADDLSNVLAGLDPGTGRPLGRPLLDRVTTDGKQIRAVGGFDATFSAPKSLSIWWGLTGDERLAECHDIAVRAAAAAFENHGSTTRIRSNGRRMHVDTAGLTMAVFRQSTSRADDPQLHSHIVIASKVQTLDGRWYALDARVLKKHQRTFGGLYQSVLRAELTNRFGVAFDDIGTNGLDDAQSDAATAVAGHEQLVLVVGPAGAGKTRMLDAAVFDLHSRNRHVIGVAPTARAAEVLQREANLEADTVAKLVHDLDHPGPDSIANRCREGTTLVVDEAGMLNTADLHRLVEHVERHQWRLVLVGDPQQLAPVGRGGMFAELCHTGRTVELDQLHRFTELWESTASLKLREGDTTSLDWYETFDRIRPGRLDQHLDAIADLWLECDRRGETLAITTTRTADVAAINERIQHERAKELQLDPDTITSIGDEWAMVGDIVATRHNDRRLRTTRGDHVRNRERWIVTDLHPSGDLTVTRLEGEGSTTLPADYVAEFVELAYATTEYGAQGITADRSVTLATSSTTGRGLYVGMTRGRADNLALVVTDEPSPDAARDVLENTLATDWADISSTRHRIGVNRSLTDEPVAAHPDLVTSPGLSIEL